MNNKEFGILVRILRFIEKYNNAEVISELMKEFQDELTDEQMDSIIKEFKFHDYAKNERRTEHKGPTPGAERFDFF